MEPRDPLEECLTNTHELETFLHAFLSKLDDRQLKMGDDVTDQVKRLGLALPAVLKDATITWEGHEASVGTPMPHRAGGEAAARDDETIVLTQPGHPDALGLVIKCVKIRKWRICLECGWLWCRIVVTRRF